MNDALQNEILKLGIWGLILVLGGIVAFAAKRWFVHVENLHDAIESLRNSIVNLGDKFVSKDQYDRDLRLMHQSLGRRSTDPKCPAEDCPYEKTDPGTKVLITGSGAKRLADFTEALKPKG